MREPIRQFVHLCARILPVAEPVYEFGSLQVEGQEGYADLRPFFPGKEYVGCDRRGGPGVDRILDLHEIDLPDGSVGCVLCLDTLEHVEFPRKALSEMHRVLKAGGLCAISSVMDFPVHDHPNDYWRYTPEGFRSLLGVFDTSHVEFAGAEDFPHAVVGVGIKGELPKETVDGLATRLERWRSVWRDPRGPRTKRGLGRMFARLFGGKGGKR